MVKEELIRRSPLRILEKSTHGGLGTGNLGVIAARKGVGKTAFLVHLATDQLFQGRHVIHVSFSAKTDHIIEWYEDIFREITQRSHLEGEMDAHDQAIRNRVIMNFKQEGVKAEQVCNSLQAMIGDGHFNADVIVVDGYNFGATETAELNEFKRFAAERGLAIWFSASIPVDEALPESGEVPAQLRAYQDLMSIIIMLRPEEGHISVDLVKDHSFPASANPHLRLDEQILLISKEPQAEGTS